MEQRGEGFTERFSQSELQATNHCRYPLARWPRHPKTSGAQARVSRCQFQLQLTMPAFLMQALSAQQEKKQVGLQAEAVIMK